MKDDWALGIGHWALGPYAPEGGLRLRQGSPEAMSLGSGESLGIGVSFELSFEFGSRSRVARATGAGASE